MSTAHVITIDAFYDNAHVWSHDFESDTGPMSVLIEAGAALERAKLRIPKLEWDRLDITVSKRKI